MKKLKIALYKFNGSGTCARIENADECEISICEMQYESDPVKCCHEAAKRLREAADLFEKLAAEKEPFKDKTQKAVNKR